MHLTLSENKIINELNDKGFLDFPIDPTFDLIAENEFCNCSIGFLVVKVFEFEFKLTSNPKFKTMANLFNN